MRHRLNDTDVVSELLDGEVIVIHLHSGTYYSMQANAADVWSALVAGWTVDEIADHAAAAGLGDRAALGADVARFVASLETEGLLAAAAPDAAAGPVDFLSPTPWVAPELQVYTDMQDWMLVDPIHEVAEEGWPIRPTDEK